MRAAGSGGRRGRERQPFMVSDIGSSQTIASTGRHMSSSCYTFFLPTIRFTCGWFGLERRGCRLLVTFCYIAFYFRCFMAMVHSALCLIRHGDEPGSLLHVRGFGQDSSFETDGAFTNHALRFACLLPPYRWKTGRWTFACACAEHREQALYVLYRQPIFSQ